jgi:hypothetical protein
MPGEHVRLHLKYVDFGLRNLKEIMKEFARVRGSLQVDVMTNVDSANFYQPTYEEVSQFVYDQLSDNASEINIRFRFYPLKMPRAVEKLGFASDGRTWEKHVSISVNEFTFELVAFVEQEEDTFAPSAYVD